MLFLKPTSSYLENGGIIEVPHPLESLHHEVELAVVIGQKARDVTEAAAMDFVGGSPNNSIFILDSDTGNPPPIASAILIYSAKELPSQFLTCQTMDLFS